jgi:hypothetical protein
MLRFATAALCSLTLFAACGGDDDDGGGAGDGDQAGGGVTPALAANLTVTVRPEGPDGLVRTRRVECERVGRGAAERVCRALNDGNFAPVPRMQPCTAIYGGPGLARVTGTFRGRHVDARFSLEDGCEIARWQRNRELLGPPNRGQTP